MAVPWLATTHVQNYAGSRKKVAVAKREVLLRLTGDLFALFLLQWDNTSTDRERRAGLSAIAEPLVCLRRELNDDFLASSADRLGTTPVTYGLWFVLACLVSRLYSHFSHILSAGG